MTTLIGTHEKPRILYREGYKYQLNQAYQVQLDHVRPPDEHDIMAPLIELTTGGMLTIKYGYAWDGASGPTRDTKDTMRGSLVHDALYQLCRMGALSPDIWREEIDAVFKRILQTDGMGRVRRWYWHRAVRRFAAKGASTRGSRPVLVAP